MAGRDDAAAVAAPVGWCVVSADDCVPQVDYDRMRAERDRLRARVAELEAAGDELAARFKKHVGWVPVAWHLAAASPDDAPTTETHVEYRAVLLSDESVTWGITGFTARREATDLFRVESRTVSTTTRTTAWKADER